MIGCPLFFASNSFIMDVNWFTIPCNLRIFRQSKKNRMLIGVNGFLILEVFSGVQRLFSCFGWVFFLLLFFWICFIRFGAAGGNSGNQRIGIGYGNGRSFCFQGPKESSVYSTTLCTIYPYPYRQANLLPDVVPVAYITVILFVCRQPTTTTLKGKKFVAMVLGFFGFDGGSISHHLQSGNGPNGCRQ